MDDGSAQNLLTDAVETAASLLRTGERLEPLLITDSWGDRRVENFGVDGLEGARTKRAEFLRRAGGDESCALVYVGHVGLETDAIVVERGVAGSAPPEMFVQRFRPRRGLFRGFKLLGDLRPVGASGSSE